MKKLKAAKTLLEKSLSEIGKSNLKKLKDLRENPETSGADFHFFMDQLQQENRAFNVKDRYQQLDEFDILVRNPYFARIDLKDLQGEDVENFYIGKFGYYEDGPIIFDWRAKVSSVYYRYRYPQKNVSYITPTGTETRDLVLKRTYEIDDGVVSKYYNNDLQLDESEIIAEKIEHRTGGVLEDIVETIQVSQLDIIEADPRQVCIVQGCVGSGKSTVAIHKLSYIFFNFPKLVKPERAILIAKNQILIGYLSTLFPKLGIFDMNYKTIRELLVHLIFREGLKINDIDFDEEENISRFTPDILRDLRKEITLIYDQYEAKLNKILDKEEYKSFSSYKYSKDLSVYENISDMLDDLEEELGLQTLAIKENASSMRVLLHKENIKTLKKMLGVLKKNRVELKNKTLKILINKLGIDLNGRLSYMQALIYVYVYLELIGLNKFKKYEYCVVDEGQDFNVLEYAVLGKLVLHGRFAILGDLNQSYKEEGVMKWEEISEVISEAKQAHTFTLDTNYRSTKPIINLAKKILSPYTSEYLPKSINRKGRDVVIKRFDVSEFEHDLHKDLRRLDSSIGIICFDKSLYNQAKEVITRQGVDKDKFIELEENTKISYIPKGVYLTMFDDVKGLEFAKVYILGLNLSTVENFKKAKEAFVAVTRAMNELTIYSL